MRVLLAAVLVATVSAAFAGPAGAAGLKISGKVTSTSVVTTICKLNEGRATSTETVTTTYDYTFSGRSGGRIVSAGYTTNVFDRKVVGVSDSVKDSHLGPAQSVIPTNKTKWKHAIKRRSQRDGKRRYDVLDIDFGAFAGQVDFTETATVPTKGKPRYFLILDPSDRDAPKPIPSSDERCTATEKVTVDGGFTVEKL